MIIPNGEQFYSVLERVRELLYEISKLPDEI